MKKNILFALAVPAVLCLYSCVSDKATAKSVSLNSTDIRQSVNSVGENTMTASNNWLSFSYPKSWGIHTDSASDEEYKVYEFKLLPPSGGAIPASIYISYYAEDNEDIATYKEFIRVNSQNILRGGKTVPWEKYEPVSETKVAGRQAFVVARNCRHFLHPNSKDDSNVMKKEKMYVLPASKGYYVIRYAAEEEYFDKNFQAFEDIAASFKGVF